MKTFTLATIITMCFCSIAAVPAGRTLTPLNVQKKFDGFSSLRTHRQGKGVEVCWSFSSADVAGFNVQRTNEDPNDPYSVWIDVGSMQSSSSRSYRLHDDHPIPGFVHYQVIAFMNHEGTVMSPVSTIHFR